VPDGADQRPRAAAHELLANIALLRSDPAEARRQAKLAEQADPRQPVSAYVEGRLLYDDGDYAGALPFFEKAVEALQKESLQMSELHFYVGDTLARLDRYTDGEAQLREEIRLFPQNTAARASLAMLCHSVGRSTDAAAAIDDLLRAVPTPEAYALAARLWTTFGEPRRAAAVRATAQRQFAARPAARGTRARR
jgi:tetratricopeptide (TPR) repeat protein